MYPNVNVKSLAQLCPTLCDSVDYSPPGSSVHGILQARILEWVAISFSKGSSQPRDQTQVSRVAGRRFNLWATREAQQIYTYSVLWTLIIKAQEMMLKFWINPFLFFFFFDKSFSNQSFTTYYQKPKNQIHSDNVCSLVICSIWILEPKSLDNTCVKGQTTRLFIIARLFILCKGTRLWRHWRKCLLNYSHTMKTIKL